MSISQLGYMIFGMGCGAWIAALFHLITHAFFKAMLFLGSGQVIEGCHHEQDMRKMGGLRKKMPFPLATGECLYTKFEMDELIRMRGADILQPDVCICGGFTEMRKIAANAEAHDISIAPHNPTGPLATVVNTHFALATSNCTILEYRPQSDLELAMVPGAARPEQGYLNAPDGPGWGVDLNDDAINTHPDQGPWHRGDRFEPDGSVAYI